MPTLVPPAVRRVRSRPLGVARFSHKAPLKGMRGAIAVLIAIKPSGPLRSGVLGA